MIDLLNLSIQFSGRYLFQDVKLKINKTDKIALVGSNGTGKSTLLKLIYGTEKPESGEIQRQKGIRIGYLPQEFVTLYRRTLIDEVKSSLQDIIALEEEETFLTAKLKELDTNENEKFDIIHKIGELNHRKEDLNYYTVEAGIKKVLTGLGFAGKDFLKSVDEFSGGWQMRIELAKILLGNNHLILLDEPTNHLDLESLGWLIEFLIDYEGALLIVSHDKYFINSVTNKTLELLKNKIYIFNGSYDKYLILKEMRKLELESNLRRQQRKITETERFIDRFRYKATKARQVQSRIKQLEKIERIEIPEEEDNIEIKFPEPPRSYAIPVELINVTKSFDENIIFENLNFRVERGDKIAFVGPNGAGKTTLAKIIAEKLLPESGRINIGTNTLISYYAQEVADDLEPDKNILETLAGISGEYTENQLRTLLGAFLFTGDDVFKKINVLSGGEKSRVALSKILLTKANFIILDEPTNHLDQQSKKILQKALLNYSGSLIIVTHDVDFIRPLATRMVEIKNRQVIYYYGGIDYYLEKKKEKSITERDDEGGTKISDKLDKKNQKRMEARFRQDKYRATKDVNAAIESLETQIEILETEKKSIEAALIDSNIYSNPQSAKEKTNSYKEVKAKLDEAYTHWTELNARLEEIQRTFEDSDF